MNTCKVCTINDNLIAVYILLEYMYLPSVHVIDLIVLRDMVKIN